MDARLIISILTLCLCQIHARNPLMQNLDVPASPDECKDKPPNPFKKTCIDMWTSYGLNDDDMMKDCQVDYYQAYCCQSCQHLRLKIQKKDKRLLDLLLKRILEEN